MWECLPAGRYPTALIVLFDVMKPFSVECFTAVIHPIVPPTTALREAEQSQATAPLMDRDKKNCLHSQQSFVYILKYEEATQQLSYVLLW